MVLNIACAIFIVLLIIYVMFSVFAIYHYISFKNVRILELHLTISFIVVYTVVFIMILFKVFPSINIEFKL